MKGLREKETRRFYFHKIASFAWRGGAGGDSHNFWTMPYLNWKYLDPSRAWTPSDLGAGAGGWGGTVRLTPNILPACSDNDWTEWGLRGFRRSRLFSWFFSLILSRVHTRSHETQTVVVGCSCRPGTYCLLYKIRWVPHTYRFCLWIGTYYVYRFGILVCCKYWFICRNAFIALVPMDRQWLLYIDLLVNTYLLNLYVKNVF